MNDVMNRFGFTHNTGHGRVPGPYVPLQDEPQEVSSVYSRKNTKTVLVPQIQSMKDYILKHCKRIIFRALNQYVEMWINMKSGMEFYTDECGHLRNLPERPYWRLSNYMIPILRKDEIETGAEELLLKLCPNALSDLNEHNAFVLAERMGLNVERLPLYNKNRTLSMLFFCTGTVTVQDDPPTPEGDPPEPYTVTIPGNTILINTRAVHKDYCQLEIYHECIHYDWHFMFYRLQHMHTNDINALKTKRIVITDSSQNKNPLTWMEWQANRGSFGLMMPLTMMSPLVNEQRGLFAGSSLHWGKRYDLIARKIAREYDLPKFRVRARLIQMNCIAAKGALNYVDGSYIEPFAFDLSKGNGNYTFVLTRENLFEEYQTNPAFRERMDSGRYVYADGHICLNDERYVTSTSNGLRLTSWANAHVDECCLRFINVYEPCGLSDYCFGCLNSDEEYNRHYISFAEAGDELSAQERLEHMNRVLNALPDTFPETLSALMAQAHITEENLEERSGISVSTISRLKRIERNSYSMDQVVALCIALQLPPWLSSELLAQAGLMLRRTKQHRAYRLILDCMFMDSLETVQNFLRSSGCEALKLKA